MLVEYRCCRENGCLLQAEWIRFSSHADMPRRTVDCTGERQHFPKRQAELACHSFCNAQYRYKIIRKFPSTTRPMMTKVKRGNFLYPCVGKCNSHSTSLKQSLACISHCNLLLDLPDRKAEVHTDIPSTTLSSDLNFSKHRSDIYQRK